MKTFLHDISELVFHPSRVRKQRAAQEAEIECVFQEAVSSVINRDTRIRENIATTKLLNEALAGSLLTS